jgi:uncharacterized membrane protein YfcA
MTFGVAALVVAAGVLVGVFSALFGVGGGLLMVPFMVLALDESQHLAEGTSLLVIVPTALAGALAHRRHGFVSLRHAALLAAGGVGGVYLGASAALEISPEWLRALFGAFLAVMGIRSVLEGVRSATG